MLRFTRVWLPAVVCLLGAVLMALGHDDDALEGGSLIISAGLSIWLLNLLYRYGVAGDRVRDHEAEARTFFDRWGHWPDEPGPGHRPGARAAAPARRSPARTAHRPGGGLGASDRRPPTRSRRGHHP